MVGASAVVRRSGKGNLIVSECPTVRSTFDMVATLQERDYSVEQIAGHLQITVKRARALINELERRKPLIKEKLPCA